MSTESHLADKLESLATKTDVEHLRSSMFRWMLTFFLPLWVGVYGTLIAILLHR